MHTVTLEVSSREEVNHRFLRAFEGEPQGEIISFETPALLFKVLTQKRWELLSMMTGAGPITLREAARRVERDVKAVHGDVHALLNAGILQKTEDGRIVFPFDAVRVNFVLQAA
ncbi:MAG TPA: transcriptional regulator [Thermoanaerobaculia bacterium]|jgi:predicted transcriptional regulator|nr:transcriptional regulator [Thermoanaerobaculia bacterium]